MRVVAFSDTHGFLPELPDGDILIFAGDFTRGWDRSTEQCRHFARYLQSQPHKHKIIIAGNHDRCFEYMPRSSAVEFEQHGITYLHHQDIFIGQIRVFGSPYHPRIAGSFGMDRDELRVAWSEIPSDTRILVTHGPPVHLGLDGDNLGDLMLAQRVSSMSLPLVHVFGHIHEGFGQIVTNNGYELYNVSYCNESYQPVNHPVVFEVPDVDKET